MFVGWVHCISDTELLSVISPIAVQSRSLPADRVVPVRVIVPQSVWLLIPEEYESRDIFCCHRPITCRMKCHGKFCCLCPRHSNLWWLKQSLCSSYWRLSVFTKLLRFAAAFGVLMFCTLRPLLPQKTCCHWANRVGKKKLHLYLISGSFTPFTPRFYMEWFVSLCPGSGQRENSCRLGSCLFWTQATIRKRRGDK